MNWTTIWSQSAAPSFAKGMLQGKKKTVIFKVTSQISGGTIKGISTVAGIHTDRHVVVAIFIGYIHGEYSFTGFKIQNDI